MLEATSFISSNAVSVILGGLATSLVFLCHKWVDHSLEIAKENRSEKRRVHQICDDLYSEIISLDENTVSVSNFEKVKSLRTKVALHAPSNISIKFGELVKAYYQKIFKVSKCNDKKKRGVLEKELNESCNRIGCELSKLIAEERQYR